MFRWLINLYCCPFDLQDIKQRKYSHCLPFSLFVVNQLVTNISELRTITRDAATAVVDAAMPGHTWQEIESLLLQAPLAVIGVYFVLY